MKRLAVAVLLALACGAAAADPEDVKITGESKVPAFQLVKLKLEGVDPNAALLWKVRPRTDANKGKVFWGGFGDRKKAAAEWIGPPGVYDVEVTIVTPPVAPATKGDIDSREEVVTILPPGDDGKKVDPPKPPGPEPAPAPKPKPEPDTADPALVAAFKAAIATDLAVMGTAAKREHVAAFAGVYGSAAKLFDPEVFPDPAARPKTFRALFTNMVMASRLAGIAVPPAWADLRTAIENEAGAYDGATAIDDALAKTLMTKYKRIAAALNAAAN